MNKKIVVIIGAGFAGAYLAKKLKKQKNFEIFLIDKNDHFLFTPLLTEVASASLSVSNIVEFLPQILRDKKINFIKEEVFNIDLLKSLVKLKGKEIKYDYLALATGSKLNYQILGAKEFSLPLKKVEDAVLIKEKVINHLFEHKNLKLVVVGAGPTGIELISDLAKLIKEFNKYLKIKRSYQLTLIGSKKNILPGWSPFLQKTALKKLVKLNIKLNLGQKVKEIKETEVFLKNGESVTADIIILCGGVKANVLKLFTEQVALNNKGDILVNKFLQVSNFNNIFAFGDVANNEEASWEKLAQTASKQAKIVALNIKNLNSHKKLLTYQHKLKGKLIAMGKFYAIGEIYGVKVYGFLAWFIWRSVYLFKFLSLRKKVKVAVEWTVNLFSIRDLSTWQK